MEGPHSGPLAPPEWAIQERGKKEGAQVLNDLLGSPPARGLMGMHSRGGYLGGWLLQLEFKEAGSLPRVRAVKPRSDSAALGFLLSVLSWRGGEGQRRVHLAELWEGFLGL